MSKKEKKAKKSRDAPRSGTLGVWLSDCGELPEGYHRLLDSPEISTAINRIAAIVSSAPIYLMRNTKKGDERVRGRLARLVDIDPWPGYATRQTWVSWIVTTLLGEGDGNAFVLPAFDHGEIAALIPMPNAVMIETRDPVQPYRVEWRGASYAPDEILHFRLFADTDYPWRGRGYRTSAKRLAASLNQTAKMKDIVSSPDYKPPMIVAVNSDSDFTDPEVRERFRKEFLEDDEAGKPWIIPAELLRVEQVKPMTLNDLAIADTVELDKRTAAAIYGVPPWMLGVGQYSAAEFDSFVQTVLVYLCECIEETLTLSLLISDDLFYKFSRRALYAYDPTRLITLDLAMADRGYLNGDEVREDAMRSPAGLTDFRALENYIPYDMSGLQSKLTGGDHE